MIKSAVKQSIRIASIRAKMAVHFPVLYKVFDFVYQYPSYEIESMAVIPIHYHITKKPTGYHDFVWNPNFVSKLSNQLILGCTLHELLHILLGHTSGRNPIKEEELKIDKSGTAYKKMKNKFNIWSIAEDLAVNSLIEPYLVDSKKCNIEPCIPGKGEFYWLQKNQHAEYYYNEILKDTKLLKRKDFGIDKDFRTLDDHSLWGQTTKTQKTKEEVEETLKEIADISIPKLSAGTSTIRKLIAAEGSNGSKNYEWIGNYRGIGSLNE